MEKIGSGLIPNANPPGFANSFWILHRYVSFPICLSIIKLWCRKITHYKVVKAMQKRLHLPVNS